MNSFLQNKTYNYFNNPTNELDILAFNYKTDKTSQYKILDKKQHCHPYTKIYYELFKNMKHDCFNLLEIGIGIINKHHMKHMEKFNYNIGASLYMWKDFFTNANIYGLDINKNTMINNVDRIKTYCGSQIDKNIFNNFNNIKFNIIIDDGSHIPEHQLESFKICKQYLSDNFIYIVEDCKPTTFKLFNDYMRNMMAIKNSNLNYNIEYINFTPFGYSLDSKLIIIRPL
jgi:hypothetical protein